MANYNSEKFREEYSAILAEQNKSKTFKEEFEAVRAQMQGQTQSASVVNVQPQIKQNEQQIQQGNYDRSQEMFSEDEKTRKGNWVDNTIGSFKRGFINSKYASERYDDIMDGTNTADKYKKMLESDEMNFKSTGFGGAVSGVAELLGQQVYQLTAPTAAAAGGAGAAMAFAAGQMGPQVVLPEEVVTVPAGYITGASAAAVMENYQIMAASAYDEMVDRGVSQQTAKKVANTVGSLNALLEAAQLDEIISAYKTLNAVGGKTSQKLASKIAKTLTQRGVDVAKETAQEVAQEAVTMAGVDYAAGKEGKETYSAQDYGERLKDTAVSSALAFGLMNVPAAGVDVYRTVRNGTSNKQGTGGASKPQQDAADTNDGNINNINTQPNEAKSADNEAKNAPNRADNTEAADNNVGANNVEKSVEKEQLKAEVANIMGIDTRTESEKVADTENERVALAEEMAAIAGAPQSDVERVRQSAEENIAEAKAKESLDYAVELINYIGKEADIYSDSRDSAAAYNTAKRIGINLAHSGTTAMGRAVHEVGHDKTQSEQWQNYTAALDKVIATDGRLVKLMDDIDYAYRNSEDAEIRASVSFEDGTIDNAKVRNEQYLKLTEIMLPNIAKGDKQLLDAIKKDRNVLDNLLDFIRGIKNKVSIKLTKSEAAMLDEAERQLVNLLRSEGAQAEGKQYSYGGTRAYAKPEGVTLARDMFDAGVDNETIRKETGWFRGADGEWRFEIDDSKAIVSSAGLAELNDSDKSKFKNIIASEKYKNYAKLMEKVYFGDFTGSSGLFKEIQQIQEKNPDIKEAYIAQNRTVGSLQDFLKHDELYKQYPEIKNMDVVFDIDNYDTTKGAYDGVFTIHLNKNLKENENELKSVLLHEIQHFIQQREGFENGTTPDEWINKISELDDDISRLEKTVKDVEKQGSKENTENLYKQINKIKRQKEKLIGRTPFELYQSTYGEQEARDVQLRMSMSDEERKQKKPFTGDKNTVFAGSTKLAEHISATAAQNITNVLNGINTLSEIQLRDFTPKILVDHGVKDLPMFMRTTHLRENILTEPQAATMGLKTGKHIHYHGLGQSLFMQVIDSLDDPQSVYRGTKNASNPARRENFFFIVTKVKDQNGDIINVPVYVEQKSLHNNVFVDSNKIATVYGRNNLYDYIKEQVKLGNLVKVKEKSNQSIKSSADYAEHLDIIASKGRIPQTAQNINGNNLLKKKQFEIITNANPMTDNYHTGIRSVDDILTAEEAFTKDNFAGTPDWTQSDADKALSKGKVTVYSSYPIKNGVFVTPSKMEAQSYAGGGQVYNKTVLLNDVAWIDSEQGQYAPVEETSYNSGKVFSVAMDSDGNKLTEKQADYFKNSVARDSQGRLLTLYHQTNADFTEFNTKSTGAGRYDDAMPDGVFLKPTSADIGLKGKKQMVLYANMTNPLQFRDRGEMARYWKRNIDGYADIQKQIENTDTLYQQKYDAADLLEDEQYKKIRKQLINKEITAEQFRELLEETETKKILAEWTATSNELRAKAKELINGYIADNNFDGIILENDAGSFGRNVKSYVVFNSNQVKNTDNTTPTKNADIRYSLQSDIDTNEYWGENSKSRAVERHAVNEFTNFVSELLGVEYKDKTEILKKQAWKMADAAKKTGMFNSQQMINFFNDAYNLGKQESGNLDERNKQLKKELHNLGIKPLKGREYLDFVQRYKGKIMFNRNGMDIDIAYKQLAEDYPEWFSEDITNPYDMMNRIGEVYDSIQGKKVSNTEYFGEDAEAFRTAAFQQYSALVDNFIDTLNSVSRYRLALADQKQQEEAASKKVYTIEDVKAAREQAQPLMKEIARMERKNLFTAEDRNRLNDLLKLTHPADIERMQESLRATNPLAEDIIVMYEKKKMLEAVKKPIYEYNKQRKARLKSQFLDILQTADSWKDKGNTLAYMNNTFERNIDDIVTDKKAAEKLKDILPRQIHKHVADATRYKNKLRDKIRGFNIDTTKKYNIEVQAAGELLKGEATEADLIQMYGEGIVTKQYLDKIGANTKKIVETADKFRKIYNELFEKINEAYVTNGYAPMEYRQDYFPHFFDETGDTLLNKVGQFLGFDAKNMLPTEIAGRTHEFSPGRQWNSHALQRKGEKTDYNVLKGFDNYIEAAANIIHLTEDIQNLRAFENAIRYKYSDEGMKAEIDAIDALPVSEEEKQDQRKKIFKTENRNTKLNNFVVWEHEYTNLLAGKKSKADRWIEDMFGRRFYTVAKNIENRVAANMIAGNVSSALTNFIPLTQLTAEVDRRYIFTAMADTIKNIKNNDGIVEMSDFLTNRFGSEMLSLTTMQKLANKAGAPMALIDEFTSNVVTRARYLQNVDKGGMDSASAMKDADEYAASLMADRSKGALPVIFESKNPLIKLFTMFQVEQANQLNYLFKDLPRKNKEKAKGWMIWALIKLGVFSFLYNLLFEQLAGRKPAFSPVDMIVDTGKDIAQVKKGEMKASAALSNSFVRTMENLPYASSVLAVTGISEDAGRIPISGALPDLSQLAYLIYRDTSLEKKKAVMKKEFAKPVYYLGAPFAGGQAKKAAEAAALYFLNGGVEYGVESDGDKKAKFAVDTNNVLKAGQTALFGKWSSKEAREYIDNNFKGLTVGQTENFEIFKSWGMSNSEAFAKAKGTSAMTDKQLETLQQLQEAGMKNSTAYEMATTAKAAADKDGNGSIKIAEAKAYLDSRNFTREQKAILFSCMCSGVKNNPYE